MKSLFLVGVYLFVGVFFKLLFVFADVKLPLKLGASVEALVFDAIDLRLQNEDHL